MTQALAEAKALKPMAKSNACRSAGPDKKTNDLGSACQLSRNSKNVKKLRGLELRCLHALVPYSMALIRPGKDMIKRKDGSQMFVTPSQGTITPQAAVGPPKAIL